MGVVIRRMLTLPLWELIHLRLYFPPIELCFHPVLTFKIIGSQGNKASYNMSDDWMATASKADLDYMWTLRSHEERVCTALQPPALFWEAFLKKCTKKTGAKSVLYNLSNKCRKNKLDNFPSDFIGNIHQNYRLLLLGSTNFKTWRRIHSRPHLYEA